MRRYRDFAEAIRETYRLMQNESVIVDDAVRWQGVDVSKKPEMGMHVVLNHSFEVNLPSSFHGFYQAPIGPNLPWADDHFAERVGGEPLNPGRTWQNWPWSNTANGFRDEHGRFSHTYMERYWPRLAGKTDQGELKGTKYDAEYWRPRTGITSTLTPEEHARGRYTDEEHRGIYHRYGDYDDVVSLMAEEPTTRQGYLPIWFPEDTGDVHRERKPCTLGYLFDVYGDRCNITYYIRSCDLRRHFRDDIYLTVRLLLDLRERCRQKNIGKWAKVSPGTFTMHIRNLHIFRNDWREMFR